MNAYFSLGLLLLGASHCWGALREFKEFQELAARNGAVLQPAQYPTTAADAATTAAETIRRADEQVQRIIRSAGGSPTFEGTFGRLDHTVQDVTRLMMTLDSAGQSSPSKEVRDAANAGKLALEQWLLSVNYREDLYQVLKRAAAQKTKRAPVEDRQIMLVMREYRRAGMELPPEQRREAEKRQKELAALNTQFLVNISEAAIPVDFTAEELEGVPRSFLDTPGVKQPNGKFRVMANVTTEAAAIADNAVRPETRKRVLEARDRTAQAKNLPLLQQLIVLRAEIAQRLGYRTWADYQTEVRMVKSGGAAVRFEEHLSGAMEEKFREELETLRQLKSKETGDAKAQLEAWDIAYYKNMLLKERYAVDTEALRAYFPYQQTLEGMMSIYEKVFGLTFTEVKPPFVWAEGVQLYTVQDRASGAVLGAFYLDMFPRPGKYQHFACYVFDFGGPREDGKYQLPVTVLLCNFPKPSEGQPSLLKHKEVLTLFHEFGHVLHGTISRSPYLRQTGFFVPQDFVEAPSQMLESWAWDEAVLNTFAADYRDRSRKIPGDLIRGMVKARRATEGLSTRQQLAFGLIDLGFHTLSLDQAKALNAAQWSNEKLKEVYIAPIDGTSFVSYFGHLANYDAGYYGYLWSKSLALDMASSFERAPNRFLDESTGRRLREEIYAPGYTREPEELVTEFLGRKPSSAAFEAYLGVNK